MKVDEVVNTKKEKNQFHEKTWTLNSEMTWLFFEKGFYAYMVCMTGMESAFPLWNWEP